MKANWIDEDLPIFSTRPRKKRPTCLLITLCALQVLVACLQVVAQTSDVDLQSSSKRASRDPASVQLLQESITKLGGSGAWSVVHGVQVTGEINPDRSPVTFSWIDDWSAGYFRSSRTTNGPSGTHKFLESAPGHRTVTTQHRTVHVPEVPLIERLAPHVPAVSMLKAIQGKQYGLFRDAQCSTPSMTCVIVRSMYPRPRGRVLMKWFISTASGLPDHVDLESSNLLYPQIQIWETVTYRAFISKGGMMFPSVVDIQRNHGMPARLKFASFQSNPSVSDQSFAGGDR